MTSIIHPPWEDHCEWHRMTRVTRSDCAVMCNLINISTHTHTNYNRRCPGVRPAVQHSRRHKVRYNTVALVL